MYVDTKPLEDLPLPTWRREDLFHGYYLGKYHVGWIILWRGTYVWGMSQALEVGGETKKLAMAKRRVEAAFRHLYSWRFPASRHRWREWRPDPRSDRPL